MIVWPSVESVYTVDSIYLACAGLARPYRLPLPWPLTPKSPLNGAASWLMTSLGASVTHRNEDALWQTAASSTSICLRHVSVYQTRRSRATLLSVFVSTEVVIVLLLLPTKNTGLLRVGVHCMSHISVCVCVCGLCVLPMVYSFLLSILSMAPSALYCKTSSAMLSLAIIMYTAPYRASLLWGLQIKHTHSDAHKGEPLHIWPILHEYMHAWHSTSYTIHPLLLLLKFTLAHLGGM